MTYCTGHSLNTLSTAHPEQSRAIFTANLCKWANVYFVWKQRSVYGLTTARMMIGSVFEKVQRKSWRPHDSLVSESTDQAETHDVVSV